VALLELLLGHDPATLSAGTLQMRVSSGVFLALAGAVAAGVALLMAATAVPAGVGVGHRVLLWGLRSVLLAALLFLLLDPRLRLLDREPLRGHVAVLLDDSMSMRIRDDGERSRAEQLLQRLAPGQGDVARALETRFDVRYFRYGQSMRSLRDPAELTFVETRSALAPPLSALAASAASDGLGSVVVAGDGAGAGQVAAGAARLAPALRALQAAGVAVHTVGFGAPRFDLDLELADARLPSRVLRGDAVQAQVTLAHQGAGGQRARLQVERDSVVVAREEVVLEGEQGRTVVTVPLAFPDGGARTVVFRLDVLDGETVAENNAITTLVQVRDEPVQVLHVEGEPRYEVKFLRRAVAGDDTIRLRSLIRTAENKFYRLGVDDASELPRGLPATDEALFRYHAVVLGSVGDDLLDLRQQRRLQEYVARRGGGLVLLGGRRAFAEGGFSGGPLAALSPVVIPAAAGDYRARVAIVPAVPPVSSALLRIAPAEALEAAWQRLPPLTVVNALREAKPGASVLLRGDDGVEPPLVALAWHRYGRGTVVSFPVRDSWRWQMHASIPLQDMSHEQLWRGLLRHVARGAGDRLRVRVSQQVAGVGDTVQVHASALDASFRARPGAKLALAVTTPSGAVARLPMLRGAGAASEHTLHLPLAEAGRYALRLEVEEPEVDADDADDGRGADGERSAGIEVTASGREYHGAQLDARRLQAIAQATGGSYLEAAQVQRLTELIDDTRAFREVQRDVSLRQVPGLLLLLLLLACVEWIWRRRCALP
jgi:uncharacterized membrane protein